jgi:S1-C subfamily serine protease
MFVPVELLKPILPDLVKSGRRAGPARPWLGVAADEIQGRLLVTRVSPEGPADRAGVHVGDIILGVGGDAVHSQEEFYRKVWGRGAAGSEIRSASAGQRRARSQNPSIDASITSAGSRRFDRCLVVAVAWVTPDLIGDAG